MTAPLILLAAVSGASGVAREGSSAEPAAAPRTAPPSSAMSAEEWEAVVAAANEEGSVNLYSVQAAEANEGLVAAFGELYPDIEITYEQKPAAQWEPQIEAEFSSGSGVGDVYLSSNRAWMEGAVDNMLPIQTPRLAEEAWAAQASDGGALVFFYAAPYGFGWNTSTIEEPIASWDDLAALDDDVKFAVPDIETSPATLGWLYQLTQIQGEDWLRSILERQPALTATAGEALQAMIAGEVDVVLPGLTIGLEQQRQGAPIEMRYPDPQIAILNTAGILGTSPHPNAAQVFMDFLLSPEGQEITSKDAFSVLPDIPGTLGYFSDIDVSADISLIAAEDREAFIALFNELYGR